MDSRSRESTRRNRQFGDPSRARFRQPITDAAGRRPGVGGTPVYRGEPSPRRRILAGNEKWPGRPRGFRARLHGRGRPGPPIRERPRGPDVPAGSGMRRPGDGAPDRIRTCDLWLRRPTLYPTELRALERTALAASTLGARRTNVTRRCAVIEADASPPGSVADSPRCPGRRDIRYDAGTLVDPGAGGQAASRSSSSSHFARRVPRQDRHDRRSAPDLPRIEPQGEDGLRLRVKSGAKMRTAVVREGPSLPPPTDVGPGIATEPANAGGPAASRRRERRNSREVRAMRPWAGGWRQPRLPASALVPDRGLLQPYPG